MSLQEAMFASPLPEIYKPHSYVSPAEERCVDREKWRDCLWIALGEALVALILRPFQNTPFIDDWTYGWSVEWLLQHGELKILEWSSNLNVVQVLWGALFCLPVGFSFTALRVSTWVLAVGCLWGLYWLLRELDISRHSALLGTATLAVNPVFFMLGFTFMTDVPFLAFMVGASFAMVRAVRTRRTRWLVAATILACLASGVRLVGAVMPVAMVVVLLLHTGKWGRRPGPLVLALIPFIFLGILLWWGTDNLHRTADLSQLKESPAKRVQNLQYALPLLPRMLVWDVEFVSNALGLSLIPLSIAYVQVRLTGRAMASFCVLGLFSLGARLTTNPTYIPPLDAGATWSLTELGGAESLVAGFQPPVVPSWCTGVITFMRLGSAAIVLATFQRRLQSPGEAFLGWLALGHFLLMAILWLFYDRYALVLLPSAIGLLLAGKSPLRPTVALVFIIIFGAVSLVGVHDHIQYNTALWQAVDTLRQRGVPDADIDGGYIVNGWLHYAHPENAPRDEQGNILVPWLTTKNSLRYQIANIPLLDWQLVQTIPYHRWLGRSGTICILERETTLPSSTP
jgi:Dolichyl-phosphate-mannose-protein mannosyltransferase